MKTWRKNTGVEGQVPYPRKHIARRVPEILRQDAVS